MLLAMDTSTRLIGLALYDSDQVISEETWQSRNHHTVELAPAIENLLVRCAVSLSDLKVLAVALGPGSFTSLRIGLALAKGMALGLHLPMVGIPTMDIVAASQPVQDIPLVTVLQVGRGRIATAWYTNQDGEWKLQEEAKITTAVELNECIRKPTIVCGELTAGERHILERKRKNILLSTPAQSSRRPSILAELAWNRWQNGKVDDPVTIAPIYLHIAETIPE